MAKEPEDNPGSSHPGGDESPEKSPPLEGLPSAPEGQEELPFDEKSHRKGPDVDFPEAKFPQPDEVEKRQFDEPVSDTDHGEEAVEKEAPDAEVEKEASHKDEHSDGEIVEPNIASELEEGDEKPSGEEHDHGHDEYHHDYHDEYHEEHYHDDEHDYHGHEDDYGDYGGSYGDDGANAGGGDDDGGGERFGGPIKPFLDHLEDLRWTIMKVVIAVVIGMLIALIGSPYIVKFLTFPLNSAQQIQQVNSNPDKRMIPVKLGGGVVSHIRESDLSQWVEGGYLEKDANRTETITGIHLVPSLGSLDDNGTQYALQMRVDTNGSEHVSWEVELKAYGPLKSFFIALKIGLYGGLTLSMPFVIYFIAQFVLPALRIKEKKWIFRLSGFGAGLFMLGVGFCYFIIMKVALWASVGFANMLGFGADEWQAEEYISFVCKFMVGMGLAFQMPMILLFLVKVNILDYRKLSDFRMYAVVANLIIAAVITPTGDPFTLSLVAVPLHLLYELSTLIAWFWHKKELAEEED